MGTLKEKHFHMLQFLGFKHCFSISDLLYGLESQSHVVLNNAMVFS